MQDERLVAGGFDDTGQFRLIGSRIDVRIAMILEDSEVAVEADVDTGRLDQLGRVRLQGNPAPMDLRSNVAIREQHGGNVSASRPSLLFYSVRPASDLEPMIADRDDRAFRHADPLSYLALC